MIGWKITLEVRELLRQYRLHSRSLRPQISLRGGGRLPSLCIYRLFNQWSNGRNQETRLQKSVRTRINSHSMGNQYLIRF